MKVTILQRNIGGKCSGEAGIEGRELRLSTIIKCVLVNEVFSITW